MPITSCLLCGHKCGMSDCFFFVPLTWYLYLLIDEISLRHLFSMLNSPVFLSLSCYETSSIPLISFVALLWTHTSKSVSVLYWEALDSVLQIWPHQPSVDLPPAGSTFPNAALEAAGFFLPQHISCLMVSAVVCCDPQVLVCLVSCVSVSQPPA